VVGVNAIRSRPIILGDSNTKHRERCNVQFKTNQCLVDYIDSSPPTRIKTSLQRSTAHTFYTSVINGYHLDMPDGFSWPEGPNVFERKS